MKNVLLLVHDDDGEEARLQAALDLTRALEGHLVCLDIVQVPVLPGADFVTVEAQAVLLDDAREREAGNRSRTRARLAGEDVPWSWQDATGEIAVILKEAAGLADIIVLNAGSVGNEAPDMRAVVSEVVMASGKPVLAVPPSARGLDVAGPALVAWNGTRPVMETLQAVTPLLALAQGVTLLELGAISGAPAEEAAAYLSRHGIHARIDRDVPVEGNVAETLISVCESRRPAFCVIGAYGHSRLREWLLGGVTRRMLKESPVPLVVGH